MDVPNDACKIYIGRRHVRPVVDAGCPSFIDDGIQYVARVWLDMNMNVVFGEGAEGKDPAGRCW